MTDTRSASVHVELNGMNTLLGMTVINRFLSALAWKNDQPTITHNAHSGSATPQAIQAYQVPLGYSPTDCFPNEIYEITDKKAMRAIALYREGLSLIDNIPFSFLSFFKVLNVFWNDKTKTTKNPNDRSKPLKINPLIEAIRLELPNLTDRDAQTRISEISQQNPDVAAYLYHDGRCAVAHAFTGTIVDPDEVSDLYRLGDDRWLMRRLAAHVIEKQCGIKQSLFR